jgi:predicted secreted protein
MKKSALTTAALAVAFGVASPAFAVDHGNHQNIDTSVVSISGNTATLANGFTVEAPRAASAGDKVRVVLTENNELKRVFILN